MAQRADCPEGRPTPAPLVLVVEDDPGTGVLLTDLLRDAGYAVQVLDTAFGVLGEVGRLRPCVIVLDLGLPFRSGAAVLADLKAEPTTAAIPVIVVSALLEMLPPRRSGAGHGGHGQALRGARPGRGGAGRQSTTGGRATH